jgi:hypothetical protein
MRRLLLVLLLSGCTTLNLPKPSAEQAALADVGTTAYALSHGGVELNPLGYIGTTLVKGLYFIKRDSLSAEQRAQADRIVTSVWMGAAANNLVQILLAPIALPITIGIGIGVGLSIYY